MLIQPLGVWVAAEMNGKNFRRPYVKIYMKWTFDKKQKKYVTAQFVHHFCFRSSKV
jgi:hypothetical protein